MLLHLHSHLAVWHDPLSLMYASPRTYHLNNYASRNECGYMQNSPYNHECMHETIYVFLWQGRDFTIVFRSFGDDISEVVEEMNAFATSQHPSYPEVGLHCQQACHAI